MTLSNTNAADSGRQDWAPERWWHRLLRVLIYVSTFLLLVVSGAIVADRAEYFTYAYSFEPEYSTVSGIGSEETCRVSDSDYLSCGDSAEQLIERYLKAKGTLPAAKRWPKYKTVSALIDEFRKNVTKDSYTVRFIVEEVEEHGVTYKTVRRWRQKKLLRGAGVAVGVTCGWLVLCLFGYKVLLYVVHGHTRVRKV